MKVHELITTLMKHPAGAEVMFRKDEVLVAYPNNGHMALLISGRCESMADDLRYCLKHAAPMIPGRPRCKAAQGARGMSEPDAFEAMMARMLGAPIPVALGIHPTDLIPYAWVRTPLRPLDETGDMVWHLDPTCERLPTGERPIKVTSLLPHDNCAEHGWWPCADAAYCETASGAFAGEPIYLGCSYSDDGGFVARHYLLPCRTCVIERPRGPREVKL